VRPLLLLWLCASCATSPDAPLSSAVFAANPMVHSARAQAGFVSYGAPYHKWTITYATVEGCAGDTIAAIELDTLSSVSAVPVGATTLRTDQNTVAAVPSGFYSYLATPATGTVTVDSASDGFVTGSIVASVTVGGVPTDVGGTFSAPVCP